MSDNQRQKDLELIGNVLQVRSCAIMMAFDLESTELYEAAVANDDSKISEIIGQVRNEAQAEVAELEEALHEKGSLHEHLHVIANLAAAKSRIGALEQLHDLAVANVELITSGEVCYAPALKPTTDLIRAAKVLAESIEEASV